MLSSTAIFYRLLQTYGCPTDFSVFVHEQQKINNETLHAISIKITLKHDNCGLKLLHKELKKKQPQEFKFM
jgi:riboflavin synthase